MTFTFWLITVQFGEPLRHLYMWLNGREPLNFGEFHRFSWHDIHQNEEFMNIFWGFHPLTKREIGCPLTNFWVFPPRRKMKGPWPRCHRHPVSERLADWKAPWSRQMEEVMRSWTKLEGNVTSSKSYAILVMVHQKKDIFRTSFGDPCLRSIHI